ncbi:MAG: glycosyltransferase [Hyphomicrobiaceae bacterium]
MSVSAGERRPRRVYLDLTHLGRHVTGLERIAIELFEKVNFAGAEVVPVRSRGIASMIVKQQVLLPLLALMHRDAHFAFPGFPPSPLMTLCPERVVLYVHDLFLMTRRQDLGLKARLYMAWPFRIAITRLKRFLTNSAKTRAELQPHVRKTAEIALYRPQVGNVFGLSPGDRISRSDRPQPLRMVAVGTVEPRKNYGYAARLRAALAARGYEGAELHIIGRAGWGEDATRLAGEPGVTLHGYLSTDEARRIIEHADIYLSTAHDEGLGLPLLEAQFAGLPVVVADIPVFREVLGASGIFIPRDDADAAAAMIDRLVSSPGWRRDAVMAARTNLDFWNEAAAQDSARVRSMFSHDAQQRLAGARLASPEG